MASASPEVVKSPFKLLKAQFKVVQAGDGPQLAEEGTDERKGIEFRK